jgi:hypothetical protein
LTRRAVPLAWTTTAVEVPTDNVTQRPVGASYELRSAFDSSKATWFFKRHLGKVALPLLERETDPIAISRSAPITGDAPPFERFTLGDSFHAPRWKYDIAPVAATGLSTRARVANTNVFGVFLGHRVGLGDPGRNTDKKNPLVLRVRVASRHLGF